MLPTTDYRFVVRYFSWRLEHNAYTRMRRVLTALEKSQQKQHHMPSDKSLEEIFKRTCGL